MDATHEWIKKRIVEWSYLESWHLRLNLNVRIDRFFGKESIKIVVFGNIYRNCY